MNSITAPKYAFLYKSGNIIELRRLWLNSTKILIVLAVIPTFILLIYPEWIMSLFGEKFVSGAPILIVLVIGQFINVASGSVAYLLTMTGNEKYMRNIVFLSAIINIILSIVMFDFFGVIGVAISTAISISISNILGLYFIKKKVFKF